MEPMAADGAWSLPGCGHRESSSPCRHLHQRIQIKPPGSILESRGGKLLASAEDPGKHRRRFGWIVAYSYKARMNNASPQGVRCVQEAEIATDNDLYTGQSAPSPEMS